jgi:hypothetical protein
MIQPRKHHTDNDPFADKREEKALRNFKKVLKEMLRLLMRSTRSQTVSLHWVNHQRQQFVLECYGTSLPNTTFQDRIDFLDSYLNVVKDAVEPVQLVVGEDIPMDALSHYYKEVPVKYLYILPFISNKETVGLTVLESNHVAMTHEEVDAVEAYQLALGHLLYTFIELSDLAKDEAQWFQYEEMLASIGSREDVAQLMDHVVVQLQSFLQKGSVSLICRTAGEWKVVMNSAYSIQVPRLGTVVQEQSMVNEALKNGAPQFAIHINHTPRRVSMSEPPAAGATLVIPLLIHDRRQAAFVVNDENPLLFKESIKHKMTNLVRVLGLKMTGGQQVQRVDQDLFTNELGILQSNILDRIVHRELQRSALFPDIKTWVCMFTFDGLNTIRTRFGLEVLKNLQRQVARRSSVEQGKVSSLTTFHADYIYVAVVQADHDGGLETWMNQLKNGQPYSCGAELIDLTFRVAAVQVDRAFKDASELLLQLKRAFSDETRKAQMREV